jgi:hypothetical protein
VPINDPESFSLPKLFRYGFASLSVLIALATGQMTGFVAALAAETVKANQAIDAKSSFGGYQLKGEGEFNLRVAAAEMDKKLRFDCDFIADLANIKIAIKKLSVLRDIEFPKSAIHPVSGRWLVRYAYKRCGETVIYNTLFVGRKNKSPKLINFLPGYTEMAANLMARVGHRLLMQVREQNLSSKCNDIQIVDTSKPSQSKDKKSTIEIWSVKVCDQPINYAISIPSKPATVPDLPSDSPPDSAKQADFTISKLGEPTDP